MTQENIRLFKLALTEGVSNQIDKRIAECAESITPSAAHKRAIRRIINGSTEQGGRPSRKKIIIAILVAAALLLTSCAVIYRKQIANFIEEIYSSFMTLEASNLDEEQGQIGDIYELTYVPEGYVLDEKHGHKTFVKTVFVKEGATIIFEQQSRRVNYLDSENGYTKIEETGALDIYYRYSLEYHHYLWNDGDYSFRLSSDLELTTEEIEKIVIGVKKK